MFEVLKLKNIALSFFTIAIRSLIAIVALGIFSPVMASESDSYNSNLWDSLRLSFQLEDQYKRPEVQSQVNWLMNHKSYLNQLGAHSQPYLYYILQEIQKRKMPGELALLPMIESTYNPFAYSSSGAAGLWQFTSGTGKGFGLKQNWWFDGRRDIYNSTNAALNYLAYLHRFFNGNWMLAIAAYHSGEGTVQHAMHNQGSKNFWTLNLPQDTHSYVPKLLALARLIQSRNSLSSRLPYISNTPYFTKIDVGTQIDLTNAAHLAGISYPEFLKLNPGNNRWATSPQGPHTIVLPLDKVDLFVHNLKKIPQNQRSNLLAKHAVQFNFDTDLEIIPDPVDTSSVLDKPVSVDTVVRPQNVVQQPKKINSGSVHKVLHVVQKGDSFWQLTKKYHVNETDIRSWNNLSSKEYLKQGQKLTVWTPNHVEWIKKSNKNSSSSIVYYKIRSGDSFTGIAEKYNVPVKKLMVWNTKIQPTRLIPGKQVVIYL